MAESNISPENCKSTTVPDLHNAIENMGSLSREGFSQIAAIALLAITALETKVDHNILESVVHALEAIRGKAQEIENCVEGEAESVGFYFVSDKILRQYESHLSALDAPRSQPLAS